MFNGMRKANTCRWHKPATAEQLPRSLLKLHRAHRTRNIPRPLRVHGIWMSNNNLRILYSGTFRGLRALRSLDLRSNYLHTTETSSFNELSCLTSLHTDDLRDLDNSIEIHAGILDGISRLNLLELPYFDNCVREEDVFKRLEFLTDLDLYENKIQILSSGIFRGLWGSLASLQTRSRR